MAEESFLAKFNVNLKGKRKRSEVIDSLELIESFPLVETEGLNSKDVRDILSVKYGLYQLLRHLKAWLENGRAWKRG